MAGLLNGHIAAVTGGGSGIGQGICQAYAREGARVIVLDTNPDGARETISLVTQAGGEASFVKLDVTDREACKGAAAEIARSGNISILVNNAGINRRTPFVADAAAVAKDWDDIMSINLDGMFNVTRAFLDQLRATKGRIVNIGSIQSFVHVTWPNSAAYTTSKHGVLGLTRALAAELGKDGVDTLMDMARTSVNILGNCLAAVVVAKWEGEFDSSKAMQVVSGKVEPKVGYAVSGSE